jgi:endonuclease YncB( thermonuclease family)
MKKPINSINNEIRVGLGLRSAVAIFLLGSSVLQTGCAVDEKFSQEDVFQNLSAEEKITAIRYKDKTLADILKKDYNPINTEGLISKESREYYQHVDNKDYSYSLEKLSNELQSAKLADVYNVTDIAVQDGDTFSAKTPKGANINVRLLGIDAPDEGSDYYAESKASLTECLSSSDGKTEVTLIIPKKEFLDKKGRVLAQAFSNGKVCNLEQISNGMAWFYRPMFYQQFDFEVSKFLINEVNARYDKVGIWADDTSKKRRPWIMRNRGGYDY